MIVDGLGLAGLLLAALVSGVVSGVANQRERPYVGFQQVRLMSHSLDAIPQIEEEIDEFDVLSHDEEGVVAIVPPGQKQRLERLATLLNISIDVLHGDVQQLVDEDYKRVFHHRSKRQTSSLQSLTQQYQTRQEIDSFVDRVATSSTNAKVTTLTVGTSHLGKPIRAVMISSKTSTHPDRKIILVDAGIHAREWISPATAVKVIYELAFNSTVGDLLEYFDWLIIPVLNPDGYQYSWGGTGRRLWRKNRQPNSGNRCVGTDLNRNFGYKWGGLGASASPCSETYRGSAKFSTPESRALRDVMLSRKGDIVAYLSLHAYGQFWLYPWGYNRVDPEDRQYLHSLSTAATDAMNRPYRAGTSAKLLYPASGGSDDYGKGWAGIAASFTVELPPAGGISAFSPAPDTIPGYTSDAWRGLQAFARELAAKTGADKRPAPTTTTVTTTIPSTTTTTTTPPPTTSKPQCGASFATLSQSFNSIYEMFYWWIRHCRY